MVSNLEELIEQFNQKNINVFLTTNATLLNPARSLRLIKSGVKGIFFSVESASEAINDEIRGKGTFHIFYENIKNFMSIYLTLRKKNYIPSLRPALSCTVSSLNFSTDTSIQKMFSFAQELGISDITFNFLVDYGGCKNLIYNKEMTNFELANQIVRISKEFPEIYVRLPMKQIEHDFLKKRYGLDVNIYGAKGSCPAGDGVAYVDAELNMYPCIWLAHKEQRNRLATENTVSLYGDVPLTMFASFMEKKQKCITVFQECSTCKYKNKCIPVCPCQENSEIMECMGKACPTRKEIREYHHE